MVVGPGSSRNSIYIELGWEASTGRSGRLPAAAAGAEDLQCVADRGEAVLGRQPVGPALDCRSLDLDRGAAHAADEMVMVRPAAPPVELLAGRQAHRVDLAGV